MKELQEKLRRSIGGIGIVLNKKGNEIKGRFNPKDCGTL